MNILITGGGGFLGSWIVTELLKEKKSTDRLINLSRHRYLSLEEKGVECVCFDLSGASNQRQQLLDIFQKYQIDSVFHVASHVSMWGRREDFQRINTAATEVLLEVAKSCGVKKFIYTSTPSVVFGEGQHEGSDESLHYPEKHYSFYAETKALAEKSVIASATDTFFTAALRPHLVFGPGDQNLIPRVLRKAREKKLKRIGSGENYVDVLYVEEAARAHVLCFKNLKAEHSGRVYFLGQGPVNLWEFIENILKLNNIVTPLETISEKQAFWLARIFEWTWRTFGILSPEPPLTKFTVMNLSRHHWYNHQAAYRDFGWRPEIDLSEALKRTFKK
jgi:nucleoside-diphosphate-sugar epimerase